MFVINVLDTMKFSLILFTSLFYVGLSRPKKVIVKVFSFDSQSSLTTNAPSSTSTNKKNP